MKVELAQRRRGNRCWGRLGGRTSVRYSCVDAKNYGGVEKAIRPDAGPAQYILNHTALAGALHPGHCVWRGTRCGFVSGLMRATRRATSAGTGSCSRRRLRPRQSILTCVCFSNPLLRRVNCMALAVSQRPGAYFHAIPPPAPPPRISRHGEIVIAKRLLSGSTACCAICDGHARRR